MNKFCLFVLFLICVSHLAMASEPMLSQPFTITMGPGSNQIAPAAAYNSEYDQYLVVWQDDRNADVSGYDLYGQLLASDGSPLGKEFVVSDAPDHQRFPAVAYNSADNQYLVVWSDAREESTRGIDIFAQRVDLDGTLIGSDFRILTAPGNKSAPSLAYNGADNEYLIIWTGDQVVGQRISSGGDPMGPNFIISPNPAATTAALAYNEADDQYMVVWSIGSQIFGQRVAANGDLIAANFPISVPPPMEPPFDPHRRFAAFAPSIAYNSKDDEYMVFWSEGFWVTLHTTRNFEAFAQRVNSDGTLLGPKFRVSDSSGIYSSLNLIYNSTNYEYMAIWAFQSEASGSRHMFGQRVNPPGGLIGTNFAIAQTPRNQDSPAVAFDSTNNGYLVAWSDDREVDTRRSDIFGELVLSDGSPEGKDFRISPDPDPGPTPALGNQSSAAVAYNSTDDQYMAVWIDAKNLNGPVVVGQLLGSGGDLIGPSFAISSPAPTQRTPSVVYNGTDNQYLVIWAQQPTPSMIVILGQRVSAEGELLGANFPLSDARAPQLSPAAAYNSKDNQYLIVWADERNFPTNRFDLFGQLVDSYGNLIGSNIAIYAGPGDQTAPTIAYNSADNQYLVAWEDNRDGVTNQHIYGQLLESDGTLVGPNFPITTAGRQVSPSLAYNSKDNEYVVVWSDTRVTGARFGIFGHRVAADGNLSGSNFTVSTTPENQPQARIVYNRAESGYLIVWFDVRNLRVGERAVYAQRVDSTGRRIEAELLIVRTNRHVGAGILPSLGYNGMKNQYLVLWDDDRELGTDRDVIGRLVGFPTE